MGRDTVVWWSRQNDRLMSSIEVLVAFLPEGGE